MLKSNSRLAVVQGAIAAGILLACALFVYRYVVPYALVGWDEAAYLLWGYRIHAAIRQLDLPALIRETRAQYLYPPVQAWFWAVTTLPFGYSVTYARILNLFWFLAGGVFVYAVASGNPRHSRSADHTAALLATALYAVSPLVLVHAGIGLKETIGSALTLMFVYAYFRVREKQLPPPPAVLLLLALLFTKYHYATFVLIALGMDALYERVWLKDSGYRFPLRLLAVSAIAFVTWISLATGSLRSFITEQNDMTGAVGNLADKLLFYPRSIVFIYAPHPILGILTLGSVAYAFRFFRTSGRIRFMIFAVLANVGLVALWLNNLQDRFIFTIFPLICILAAWMTAGFLRRIPPTAVGAILLSVTVFSINLPSMRAVVWGTGGYTLMYPLFNQADTQDRRFSYDRSGWAKSDPRLETHRPEEVFRYILRQIDTTKPYEIIGYSNMFSPKLWQLMLALEPSGEPKLRSAAYTVTIEILPGTRFYNREYVLYGLPALNALPEVINDPLRKKAAERTFEELGVRVMVYVPK